MGRKERHLLDSCLQSTVRHRELRKSGKNWTIDNNYYEKMKPLNIYVGKMKSSRPSLQPT